MHILHTVTGKIDSIYIGSAPELQELHGLLATEHEGAPPNVETQYIGPGSVGVIDRPPNEITIDTLSVVADGVSEITLDNVPKNSTLYVTGSNVPLVAPIDGTEGVTFDLVGTYTLRIECFPELDYSIEVEAI